MFSAVALVVLAVVVRVVMTVLRKRRHARDEEDAAYFEKAGQYDDEYARADSPHGGALKDGEPYYGQTANPSMAQLTTAAAADAYPDRTLHYGFDDAAGSPPAAGVEYPPGTAYAAAAASHGAYQYPYAYPAPPQAYAYDGSGSGAYGYEPAERVSPGAHPFADPSNVVRPAGAPPVQVVVTAPQAHAAGRESVYAMDGADGGEAQ